MIYWLKAQFQSYEFHTVVTTKLLSYMVYYVNTTFVHCTFVGNHVLNTRVHEDFFFEILSQMHRTQALMSDYSMCTTRSLLIPLCFQQSNSCHGKLHVYLLVHVKNECKTLKQENICIGFVCSTTFYLYIIICMRNTGVHFSGLVWIALFWSNGTFTKSIMLHGYRKCWRKCFNCAFPCKAASCLVPH